MMKSKYIIHTILFAIYPFLFNISYNSGHVSIHSVYLPMIVAVCFALLLMSILWLLFRDILKVSLLVSLFLIIFFSYGHVFNALHYRQVAGLSIGRHSYLLILAGVAYASAAYFTIRTKSDLSKLSAILNITAGSLIMLSIATIGMNYYANRQTLGHSDMGAPLKTPIWGTSKSRPDARRPANEPPERTGGVREDGEFAGNNADGRLLEVPMANKWKADYSAAVVDRDKAQRDIYYIILDMYAGYRSLKEIYHYDNGEFYNYLRGKGFHLAPSSRSNYANTQASLPSSLNMEYVNYFSDEIGVDSKNPTVPIEMIAKNRVAMYLKERGYKFINISSGAALTEFIRDADINIQCGPMNEFMSVMINASMLKPFVALFVPQARQRVLCTFAKLAEMHKIAGPKFVFAHMMVPHYPYVFGPNGEEIDGASLDLQGKEYIDNKMSKYLAQLIFVNKKVSGLIEQIISNYDLSPIIIVQSDHGPMNSAQPEVWIQPTGNMLLENMNIINAYYLPEGGNKLLYDSITPVNTFRLILNYYFNENYPMLDDKSYYSNSEKPYAFVDITNQIQ